MERTMKGEGIALQEQLLMWFLVKKFLIDIISESASYHEAPSGRWKVTMITFLSIESVRMCSFINSICVFWNIKKEWFTKKENMFSMFVGKLFWNVKMKMHSQLYLNIILLKLQEYDMKSWLATKHGQNGK